MEQQERIRAMEERLDRLTAWQLAAAALRERLPQAEEDARMLSDYLDSPEWRRDHADDEAGLLPPTLRRGVLSEDGIFCALEVQRELSEAWNEREERGSSCCRKTP